MVALGTELGSQGATEEVAINVVPILAQTWNLSKILHTQIFRLKVLHRKSA